MYKREFRLNDTTFSYGPDPCREGGQPVAFEYRLLHDIWDIILLNANKIDPLGRPPEFPFRKPGNGLFDSISFARPF